MGARFPVQTITPKTWFKVPGTETSAGPNRIVTEELIGGTGFRPQFRRIAIPAPV